jgi:hypothetical protein
MEYCLSVNSVKHDEWANFSVIPVITLRSRAERFWVQIPAGEMYFSPVECVKTDSASHQPPVQWVPWFLAGGKAAGA